MTVYPDLPINTTRCPVCGSKRIKRLYNHAPAVIASGGRALQHVIDQAGSEAQSSVTRGRDARLNAQKHDAPMFAVPLKQLGGALAAYGIQAPQINMAGSRPTMSPAHPIVPEIRRAPPRPQPGSLTDGKRITKEGRVVEAGP